MRMETWIQLQRHIHGKLIQLLQTPISIQLRQLTIQRPENGSFSVVQTRIGLPDSSANSMESNGLSARVRTML